MQLQQLFELEADSGLDQVEYKCRLVEICYNLTANQVDSLTDEEFRRLYKALDFLSTEPACKPVKHVDVNGRRYRMVYDVRNIRASRYIETKTFNARGFIQELHKVAASIVMPQVKSFWGRWKDGEYDAAKHEHYANDLRQAPITAIYGSALFFCEVFRVSIANLTDYLTQTIPTAARKEIETTLTLSLNLMAGNTTSHLSQTTSG